MGFKPANKMPLLIGVSIIVLCSLLSWAACRPPSPLGFDKARWQNEPEVRARMVESYSSHYGIWGRRVEDLEVDLGPRDIDRSAYARPGFAAWALGREQGSMAIDYDYLVVELDGEKITGWTIVDDDWIRSDENLRQMMLRP
jgi:hypothetical protein